LTPWWRNPRRAQHVTRPSAAGDKRVGDTRCSVESAQQVTVEVWPVGRPRGEGQNHPRHTLATASGPRLDIPKGHEYADSPVHLMVPGMQNEAWDGGQRCCGSLRLARSRYDVARA
jgi:hypothetical protein